MRVSGVHLDLSDGFSIDEAVSDLYRSYPP